GGVLDVRGGDGDAAGALFGRLVDLIVREEGGAARLREDLGDGRRERRLAVIDVADRADVDVGLAAVELFLAHGGSSGFAEVGAVLSSSTRSRAIRTLTQIMRSNSEGLAPRIEHAGRPLP